MQRASLNVGFNDLLAELRAAEAILVVQAEGLKNFAAEDVSPDTKGALRGYEATWRRRIDQIDAVIRAITDLEDSGYPEMPQVILPPGAYSEVFAHAEENNAAEELLHQAPPVTLPQPKALEVS